MIFAKFAIFFVHGEDVARKMTGCHPMFLLHTLKLLDMEFQEDA